MKSPTYLLFIATLSICSACADNCEPMQKELNDVKQELAERDSSMARLSNAFSAIDSNLTDMQSLETVLASELGNGASKDEALIEAGVEKVKSIMAMNQAHIEQLKEQLETETGNSAFLRTVIVGLETKVAEANRKLALLDGELVALNDDYRILIGEYALSESERDALKSEVKRSKREAAAMEAQMRDMTNRINTVYVTMGTKQELVEKGVLEGGGLLKSRNINEDVDRMAFQPYDMRELSEVKLGADKIKLVTDHPSDSYTMRSDRGSKVLVIDNPKEFWSLSKYLIVIRN